MIFSRGHTIDRTPVRIVGNLIVGNGKIHGHTHPFLTIFIVYMPNQPINETGRLGALKIVPGSSCQTGGNFAILTLAYTVRLSVYHNGTNNKTVVIIWQPRRQGQINDRNRPV
jgi:hypothetical protein